MEPSLAQNIRMNASRNFDIRKLPIHLYRSHQLLQLGLTLRTITKHRLQLFPLAVIELLVEVPDQQLSALFAVHGSSAQRAPLRDKSDKQPYGRCKRALARNGLWNRGAMESPTPRGHVRTDLPVVKVKGMPLELGHIAAKKL